MAGEVTGFKVTGDSTVRKIDYNSLANKPTIPTKTSQLTNDSGFVTNESDPTVPSWAKQQSKPTYTAQEVGALPDTTVVPSKTSDLDNDSGFITEESIDDISIKRNSDGELYAVLEGAASLTETDPTVPSWAKQPNKPTYTAQEVGALPSTTPIPTRTSDLTNDSGFITSIPVDNDTIMINEYGELYVALGIAEEETF